MKQIAIGGIAIECCTFSRLTTRLEDLSVWRGDDLLALYPSLSAYQDVIFTPLVQVRATPGGTLARDVYEQLKQELIEGLRSGGQWDGVYLDLHGALSVVGMTDAEADLTGAIRAAVGEQTRISASFDLHGNLSEAVVGNLDLLTAYRTAPHIDMDDTRSRAIALLVESIRHKTRPVIAFARLPMLLPGEMAMTTSPPADRLYASLAQTIAEHDLLDASYFVGYVWADEARTGASAAAVGLDPAATEKAVQALADSWWNARHEFDFGMPTASVDEAISMAVAAADRAAPVFISDAGDNITGGGVGDVPYMLERLIAHGVTNAIYAALVDSSAVTACFDAGLNAQIPLMLGGKLDTTHGLPLAVEAVVRFLHHQAGGQRQAVIETKGIRVILTERRTAFTEEKQFAALGLSLQNTPITVVKLGYLFPDLQRIARTGILAFSPGALNPNVRALRYQHIRRPIFPLDD